MLEPLRIAERAAVLELAQPLDGAIELTRVHALRCRFATEAFRVLATQPEFARELFRRARRIHPADVAGGRRLPGRHAAVGHTAIGHAAGARRTVLVAAAPCALVIAIPITYVAAIGAASRRGILIKGGVYLEELAQVQVLALDKTGTLTQGRPHVVTVAPAPGESEASLLAAAAAVEQRSEHPLARAVIARAEAAGIGVSSASDFEALIGAGARATVDGRRIMIGSPALMTDNAVDVGRLAEEIERLESSGQTVIVTATDGRTLGEIGRASCRERVFRAV